MAGKACVWNRNVQQMYQKNSLIRIGWSSDPASRVCENPDRSVATQLTYNQYKPELSEIACGV